MMASGKWLIYNAKIVKDTEILENGVIGFDEGKITFIGTDGYGDLQRVNASTTSSLDARGGWVLPGFIDVHVHGGFGHDFMDASIEAYEAITKFHSAHGTTSMLATTVTAGKDALQRVIEATYRYLQTDMPYARLLGVHLEGPFISPKWPGAQNPQYISPPQLQWLEEWQDLYPQLIRMVTLAPEVSGAHEMIEWLYSHHVIAACGHTDAMYEVMEAAIEKGLRHAVHSFNAMRGLHHREPGTVGAILTDDRVSAEIIADGHHVHPACIKLLAKMKGEHNLMLITDAISAAGLSDGNYQLGGMEVRVKDNVARLKDSDSLAGSTLTMIDAFRFVIQHVGLSVPQASRMASANPARLLGMESRVGSLEIGKKADVLLVSNDLELENVWIEGKKVLP